MSPPDPALLEIFSAEQSEHLQRMRALVPGILSAETSASAYEELLRRAHTLKGAARAVGIESSETLVHALETALSTLRAGGAQPSGETVNLLLLVLDVMEDIPAALRAARPLPRIDDLLQGIGRISGKTYITAAPARPPAPAPAPPPEPQSEFVRINAHYLDELMGASAELVAAAGVEDAGAAIDRAENSVRQWRRLRDDAAPYIRSRRQDPEFAAMLECIQSAEREIEALSAEIRTEAAARRQREWDLRRLTDRLEESALRVRMVTAETVFGAFGPMLRNLAADSGRTIDFRATGLDVLVDRVVLQSLKDPVMHLLRNALSHGIEPEAGRVAARKPPTGTIRLVLRAGGERLRILVEDDGRGVDYKAVEEEAARLGISRESNESLADLVFRPGFSTSKDVTTLAGRGLGLSIVRDEVNRLQGNVQIHSEPGKGLRILISVPLSLSGQQVLLVSEAGHTFGILTSWIERLGRIERSAIGTAEGLPVITIDSRPVPLVRLADLLSLAPAARREEADEDTGPLRVAVIAVADARAAIAVDALLDVRDAVLKPTRLESSEAGLSAGAIPMPDGAVAVVLNAPELAQRFRRAGAGAARTFEPPKAEPRRNRILVVDDSITTRSLEKSVLEAHGFDVVLAVDGIDGLARLRESPIDAVITDLMMPRMDGFQLLENIRKDAALEKMPVIIVSSMESREDQERGLALGANAWIVKRKFDQRELIRAVRRIL
ncbi:MAG TPA: response regulator [Bryobacteraceae bacterium]|nr:response regulator [Bryobacteraceae bacterium]